LPFQQQTAIDVYFNYSKNIDSWLVTNPSDYSTLSKTFALWKKLLEGREGTESESESLIR